MRLVQASQKMSDLHPESLELKQAHVALAAVPPHSGLTGKTSLASHASASASHPAAASHASASASHPAAASPASSSASHPATNECAVGDKSCLALGGLLAIDKAKAVETETAEVEKAKKAFEDQKLALIALIEKRVKMENGLEVAINAALDKSKQDKAKAVKLKKAASRALTLAMQAKEREEAAAALAAQQAAEAKVAMEEAEKEARILLGDNAALSADDKLEGTLEQRAAKLQAAASAAAASARSDSDAAVEAANQLLFVYREHLNVHQTSTKLDNLQKELKDVGTQVRGFDSKKAIKDTTYDAPLEEEKPTGFLSTTLDKVVFGCCVSVIALALIALAFNAYKKRQSAAAADASAPRSAARPSSYRVLV